MIFFPISKVVQNLADFYFILHEQVLPLLPLLPLWLTPVFPSLIFERIFGSMPETT